MVTGDELHCGQCTKLAREKGATPECRIKKCRNAHCMDESIGEVINFWAALRGADTVPKEVILELADAKDATTVSMLIFLDRELAYMQEKKREAEQKKRGG